jgi:signal transduction histidine kinase
MASSTHSAARVRIAGAPAEARKLAARLTRGGIAASPDDGHSRAEVIVALEPDDLGPLRARSHKLLVVGMPSGPALQAGADDVVRAADPLLLFRRVRALIEHEDLEARVQRLTERLKALEEGVAEAAHDLRSPLHSAIGHAELLAGDEDLSQSQRQSAQASARQAARALQTCERILAGAQRPGEKDVLKAHPCDLTELVESAVASAEPVARQHLVSVALVSPARAVGLRADSELVARMLDNLIANAIRHSPRGAEVEVSAWRASPRTVRIAVADRGPGIDKTELVRLVAGLGPGRGLRISRDIAERHGGDLWAESVKGQGSRFIVELPLALDALRPQVLLVSDDGKWVREVAMALREACDVRHIGTARARLPGKRTDLVLVEAPQRRKVPALLALRTAAKGAQVPVIELPSEMGAGRLARALARLTA